MAEEKDMRVEESSDPIDVARRVAFVREGQTARVSRQADDSDLVMAFPNLIIREAIAFEILVIALTILALLFDAPLEWIANPEHTPNPAKAPWYFLGLQELLHYFPPVVAGVLIPSMVVIALIVIPYFEVNVIRRPIWEGNSSRTLSILTTTVIAILAISWLSHANAIVATTAIFYIILLTTYTRSPIQGVRGWLRQQPLSFWIMTWFVALATVLTAIGVFFRGPGWAWTWPWIDGIY